MRSSLQALDIRPVRPGDLARVAAIEASCYSMPWSSDAFRSLLHRSHVRFLVAETRGEGVPAPPLVVGYGIFLAAGGEAELVNLAVEPGFQGRGFGAALLERIIGEANEAGLRSVFLEVRDSNESAIRLYSSRGFCQISTRKRYYKRPVEDARVLRLSLSGG
jgi:ribosomal-protein-alanine N-acetyltransferase